MRKFEIVSNYLDKNINLPKRATAHSAGYDFEAAETIKLKPFKIGDKPYFIPTGIKAKFPTNEYLMLANRSSGPKRGLIMTNGIGIIDHDFYNNPENEGHIHFQFINISDKEITINKGDRIGQGVFCRYYKVDNDNQTKKRTGTTGSTGI